MADESTAEGIIWKLAKSAVFGLADYLGSRDRARAVINAWFDAADAGVDAVERAKFGDGS